ncbi:MAG: sodium:proton antiporter [Pseudomonadales bacterium]
MMLPELIGQTLSFCGIAIVGLFVHRLTRLDVTLASLLAGVAAGLAIPFLGLDIGLRAYHVRDLVFFVMLPLLIFAAAWHIKPPLLRRWLVPTVLLATVGVIICAAVTGAGLYFGIGHAQGFPWAAALLSGAILAATDPVAVVAKLQALRANEELTTLFEGESLFNDATAVVLFSLVLLWAQHEPGPASVAGHFVTVFLGGIATGLVAGLLASIGVLFLGNPSAAVVILVFSAFGSFYLAEHSFHVSGIMAVMTAAIVARVCLGEQKNSMLSGISATWDWLNLLMNTLLFALMGLVITVDMFRDQWLAMLVAVAVATVARFAAVYGCAAMTQFSRRPIPANWSLVLGWGGLRGAIAIALVLSIPVELPYWWTVQSLVFAVVLFTLFVQAPTVGKLIGRLDTSQPESRGASFP